MSETKALDEMFAVLHDYWDCDECRCPVADGACLRCRARDVFEPARNEIWALKRSAPVEAGTAAVETDAIEAALDDYACDTHGCSPTKLANARSQLLALKRAAAGRDAAIEECAKVLDRYRESAERDARRRPFSLMPTDWTSATIGHAEDWARAIRSLSPPASEHEKEKRT